MKPDWILVANASQARLLQKEADCPLIVVKAFHHPESRQRSSALGDGKAGREKSDRAFGGAAYAPRIDAQSKEHLHFARELADALEEGAREGRYAGLQVFASNPFLGELGQALGDSTRRHVAGMHALDLTALGVAEIEERARRAASS